VRSVLLRLMFVKSSALVGRENRPKIGSRARTALASESMQASLIGLGPGYPGALSVRAIELIALADQVFVDTEVDDACWAHRLRKDASVVRLDTRDGRQAQEHARQQMLAALQAGASVVRVSARRWLDLHGSAARCASLARCGRCVRGGCRRGPHLWAWAEWLGQRPLFGRRVLVTRMREQAGPTAQALIERGAEPWVFPTIELHAPPEPERLDEAVRALSSYDIVAFTSANGVEQFFCGSGAKRLGCQGVRLCQGSGDRDGHRDGSAGSRIIADQTAKEFRGEALAESIVAHCRASGRVLIPRALQAREVLPEILRAAGLRVDVVAAYETRAPAPEQVDSLIEALADGWIDAVLLTSSSTVTNLCEMMGQGYRKHLARTCLASIGPITTDTAKRHGLEPAVTATEFTLPGLIGALEAHFAQD